MIEDVRNKAKCQRAEDENGKKYAIVATESNVYKSELKDHQKDFMNTYIAVFNKKTKQTKLIQVTQASFTHILYENNRSMFEQNVVDANKLLHKEFSGKKGAASYDRKARSIANTSILENTIETTVEALDTDALFAKDIFDKSQEDRDEFRNSIFPQIKNFSIGKGVRELFTINNLIGNDIVEHLSEVAVEVLNTESKKWKFTNSYIKTILEIIQRSKSPDSQQNITKASLLIYADALTTIISKRARRFKDLDPKNISPFSYRLGQDVIANFTENSRTASKFSMQKAIIYYTILMILSTEKLEISFEDLLDNVSLAKNELMKYAQIIGCKVKGNRLSFSKANVDSSAKFNIPLHTGGKKRRGN